MSPRSRNARLTTFFAHLLLISSPISVLSADSSTSATYTWPNKQYDALEAYLYEGRRSDGANVASLVHPCRVRAGSKGSVAAEWLRFAFHDMATHNVDDGTGGLDGSIVYELDRAENAGLGFVQTVSDFEIFPNKYVSRADIIAIGAILSVSTCGGPIIPFRSGRTDVWSAGTNKGTPEPQHDLPTLVESFRKQGFNQAEMIKLTACGHTMGGVRSDDFPQLVAPNPASTAPVIVNFDTTTQFDNKVITEYLDHTTKNPLVISANDTMNSDLRVFNADGNKTVTSLTSATTFQNECTTILQRMLDTVPSTVTLSQPITLLPYKVSYADLGFEEGKFVFKTALRVTQPVNQDKLPANRTVTLFFCDRYGDKKDCGGKKGETATSFTLPARTVDEDKDLSPITLGMGYRFVHYQFVVPLDAATSLGRFWFEVDDTSSGGKKTVVSNDGGAQGKAGGKGYYLPEDRVFLVPTISHTTLSNSTGDPLVTRIHELYVATRTDFGAQKVYAEGTDVATSKFAVSTNPKVTFVKAADAPPSTTGTTTKLPSIPGYDLWKATVTAAGFGLSLDIHASSSGGDTATQDFAQTLTLDTTVIWPPTTVSKTDKKLDSASAGVRNVDGGMVARWGVVVAAGVWALALAL